MGSRILVTGMSPSTTECLPANVRMASTLHFASLTNKRNRGAFISTPGNKAATLLYAPLCIPSITFFELDRHSPVILLNTVTISVADEIFATDLRRPLQFKSLVQSNVCSLYLMEPCVSKGNSLVRSHLLEKVYLVPAPLLDNDDFKWHVQNVIQKGRNAIKNAQVIRLQNGRSLEEFRTVFWKVPWVLERLALQDFSEDPSPLHNASGLLRSLQPYGSQLLLKKEAVWGEYLDDLR